jgi:3'-phosphoadenosine 5'-phosphosulfate sulfotransferase (PAPS reductase)/FAD synthetase
MQIADINFASSHTPVHAALPVTPVLSDYDRIVVFFSGGKDSVACVLKLIEMGVDRSKVELHHHDVDGREGSTLMDWPVTRSYVQAAGDALGMKVFFSWKVGGFEGEMLRHNSGTQPVTFTRGDGTLVTTGGDRSKNNTRRKFPQVSASLQSRWCSSVVKIEVGDRLINNDERFLIGKTLVVTGERAEESAGRAKYATFEPHRRDNRNGRKGRWVDHWRPVHGMKEEQIWNMIERHRVFAHPAYWVGLGRASCKNCIFGSAKQWATMSAHAPENFKQIADYEVEFGYTIHRTKSVVEQAASAKPYPTAAQWMPLAMSGHFDFPFFMDKWEQPAGAYGESCGPV